LILAKDLGYGETAGLTAQTNSTNGATAFSTCHLS